MGAGFEVLAEDLNHPEGGEIYAVTLDGWVEQVASTGGSLLGIAVDGRGRVYACDEGNGEVVRLDPATGALEHYAHGPGGREMDTPNMLAFDEAGNLYVTCSGEDGEPSVLVVGPDRQARVWTDAVAEYPNGVCLDGDALLVVASRRPALVRVPILRDGSAGAPVVAAPLPDTEPDGVTLGADGAAYVPCYRPDGILRVAGGEATWVVEDPLAHTFDAPTNLAFCGEGLATAVVANVGDRFLSVGDLGVRGAALAYPELP
jgi:gluconolactonase